MASPLAYALWLATQAPPRAMLMKGLTGLVTNAALTDADMKPGQPPRASGYGEDRSGVYSQELFARSGEEPRTVHLGLDVFAPVGAEVLAPLPGRVHSFADNDRPGDYGPCIILEHDMQPGVVFHTLYGHLSRASLEGLSEGQAIEQGARIGRLGARTENGGWAPHLHFQVILDIGDRRGDYPGVCKRSEQDRWLAICPDPAPFLGIATPED
jgi:murein DD-endopeptidase MepM/ murein hydrolase activator NlpD